MVQYLSAFIYFCILFVTAQGLLFKYDQLVSQLLLSVLGLHCSTGFLQLRELRLLSACGARASHCGGFSSWGAGLLGEQASVLVAQVLRSFGSWSLEHRLNSCGAWAQLLQGMWDLPGLGIEPISPALAGGFFLAQSHEGRPLTHSLRQDFYLLTISPVPDTNQMFKKCFRINEGRKEYMNHL